MLIVHVDIHVRLGEIESFRAITLDNAQNSIQEAGVARFDVLQDQADPTHFVLVEVYDTPEDAALHKETAHYQRWRDTVAAMMATPRQSGKYITIFPDSSGWRAS